MKHLFRILSSIILAGTFIYALVNTYDWKFITIEVVVFFVMCGVIIAIDNHSKLFPIWTGEGAGF